MVPQLASKSESLFDSLFGRKPLAPIREHPNETPTSNKRPVRGAKLRANESLVKSASASKKKRTRNAMVRFLESENFDQTLIHEKPIRNYNRVTQRKKPQKSQKDQVLEAIEKSNLPDFDSLPPLTVVDVNRWEVDQPAEKPADPLTEECLAVFDVSSTLTSRKRRYCSTPQEIYDSTLSIETSSSNGPEMSVICGSPEQTFRAPFAPRMSVDSRFSTLSTCMKNAPQSTPLNNAPATLKPGAVKSLKRNVFSTSRARATAHSHVSTLLRSDFTKFNRTILPASPISPQSPISTLGPISTLLFASTVKSTQRASLHTAIESFDFAFSKNASVIYPDGHEDMLTARDKVLALCSPSHITSFHTVFTCELLETIKKIGEGSYGEVFSASYADGTEIVLKIIPFELFEVPEEQAYEKLLPELVIFNTFNMLYDGSRNRTPNFVRWINSACVQGAFPDKLLAEWDDYDEKKGSENTDPRAYSSESLHLIVSTNNGGIDLESYKLSSAEQALSIFLQVAFTLAAAEAEFQFEHRDLHWGNILISPCDQDKIEYTVNDIHHEVKSSGLMVSVIDFTLSRITKDGYVMFSDLADQDSLFTGLGRDAGSKGDYQFDVYRSMKEANENNWRKFTPKTNILWLDYLLDKLLTGKKYRSRRREHKSALDILTRFQQLVKPAPSASSLVSSSFMAELMAEISN